MPRQNIPTKTYQDKTLDAVYPPRKRAARINGARKRALLEELHKEQSGICALCGEGLPRLDRFKKSSRDPMRPTIDHIVPKSKGGTNARENLQITHLVCNKRKGNGDPRISPDWHKLMKVVDRKAVTE